MIFDRCSKESGPVPLGTAEAFFTSAQHREAIRCNEVGFSAAHLTHWNHPKAFSQLLDWQVASAAQQSPQRFPTTACALGIARLTVMQELMLILEKSWCLSRQNCSILQLPSGLHSKLHSACPQPYLADGSRQLGKSGFDIRQ